MARFRLREARPDTAAEREFYAGRYPDGYRHRVWPDHVERVGASVGMLRRWQAGFRTAADLSCGDGAILRALAPGLDEVWLGDLNPAPPGRFWSQEGCAVRRLPAEPLPDSLARLPRPVDLYVCSETLEHLADPDWLLARLTAYTRYLFVSTPIAEPAGSGNTEHYWSWDVGDVERMLTDTGWTTLEHQVFEPASTRDDPGAYRYQLWLAVNQ